MCPKRTDVPARRTMLRAARLSQGDVVHGEWQVMQNTNRIFAQLVENSEILNHLAFSKVSVNYHFKHAVPQLRLRI